MTLQNLLTKNYSIIVKIFKVKPKGGEDWWMEVEV